jgi:hypothetical protein
MFMSDCEIQSAGTDVKGTLSRYWNEETGRPQSMEKSELMVACGRSWQQTGLSMPNYCTSTHIALIYLQNLKPRSERQRRQYLNFATERYFGTVYGKSEQLNIDLY